MASPSTGGWLSDEQLAPIRVQFFQECGELLAELESGLVALERGGADFETINTVFRAAHSIKGSAGIFGMDGLVRFAHDLENVLAALRSGEIESDPAVLKVLLRAADVLADLVGAARDERPPDQARVDRATAELVSLRPTSGGEAAPECDELDGFAPLPVEFEPIEAPLAEERLWRLRVRPYAELYRKANDPLVLLGELARLGSLEIDLDDHAVPLLEELNAEESYLSWSLQLSTPTDERTIREVFEFVEGDCDLDIAAVAPQAAVAESAAPAVPAKIARPTPAVAQPLSGPPPSAATVRVDLERVDRLIDLVSELVISEATLAERLSEAASAGNSNLSSALDDLRHLTRDLQESVMAIRAQPVKSLFQRMSRLVREVEAQTGKSVSLTTEGEEAEVDRAVIERLTDPLTHMIRNAIDHGIESPDGRRAANKPAQGKVHIVASHRAGRVVIEVIDDGAGIDRDRVRAIAVERGLISANEMLSEEEIDNLIFEPGFSTTEKASDLSGRGVGMDVVRRGVQALGGRISVSSRWGEGTTFSLSLPLTLAVMDGMLVTVRGQSLIVPLTALVESVMPTAGDVRRLGADVDVMVIRGAHVPLIDLGAALAYRSQAPCAASPSGARGVADLAGYGRVALLVEDDAGERIALLVDDIVDQRQVVIKSLETNYRPLRGIAAATILGDGRVALIVDVNAIIASRKLRAPDSERRAVHA